MSKRIVYMGSPSFAVPPLLALVQNDYSIAAVFTQPDMPAGRGRALTPPPVKLAAEKLGLPIVQARSLKDKEVEERLARLAPDLIVVVAYAAFLPLAVRKIPPCGCLNIHASLLPRYRGGAPIHWAIVNGERDTGVTIMRMASGLDAGDIIKQAQLPISEEATTGEVTELLSTLGAGLLLDVLSLPDLGESLRRPQEHALATYARNIKKEDGYVDWQLDATRIHNLIRGLNPWPLAYTYFEGQYLRVLRSQVVHAKLSLRPGEVSSAHDGLYVGTGDKALLLLQVQLAGKRVMTGAEFSRGYLQGRNAMFHSI